MSPENITQVPIKAEINPLDYKNTWKDKNIIKKLLQTEFEDEDVNYKCESFVENFWETKPFNVSLEFLPSLTTLNGLHVYNLDPCFSLDNNSISSIRNHCYSNLLLSYDQPKYRSHLFSIMIVGNENLIIATIDTCGNICLFPPALRVILEQSNIEHIILLLKSIFSFTKRMNEEYGVLSDLSRLEKDLISAALLKVLHDFSLLDVNTFFRRFKKSLSTLFESDDLPHIFLMNRNNIYRKSVLNQYKARKKFTEEAFERGIKFGSFILDEIKTAGYEYNSTSGRWVKEVEIIPAICYNRHQVWEIIEKHRIYYVHKLSIHVDTSLFNTRDPNINASGYHPNISSSGKVCLGGGLLSKYNILFDNFREGGCLEEGSFVKFLMEVEETLEIINFDSAYFQLRGFSSKVIKYNNSGRKLRRLKGTKKRNKWEVLDE